ncbi:MAG: cytochrome c oxidase assembly protein [Chloroflexi bacterium]|nr:MAG: cytochrome c oxidase assembly protein [Chloroflexota bacterium]
MAKVTWPFDPSVYVGLVVLFFGHAWLARGAADAERKHTLYLLAGLFTVWLALETPIDTISDYYLDSVHMLQHVLLAFVAPPLMLLGLSPAMAGSLLRVPGLRAITEPIPAQLIAAVVMIAWHIPTLYDATLANESLHILEHVMFIGSGLVLYWPIVQATSAHARWEMSAGAKLVYMLLATLPQDGVALVLIFSRVPFYDFYTHAPRLLEGFTALIDQTIAGAVLMIFGKVTLGIAAGVVFFRWFGAEHRADRGIESPLGVRRN